MVNIGPSLSSWGVESIFLQIITAGQHAFIIIRQSICWDDQRCESAKLQLFYGLTLCNNAVTMLCLLHGVLRIWSTWNPLIHVHGADVM